MIIQDAIKSGKRFRRPCHVTYFDGPQISLSATLGWHDILADDWQIEEKKVEVTRGQLFNSFGAAYTHGLNMHKVMDSALCEALAKELGL